MRITLSALALIATLTPAIAGEFYVVVNSARYPEPRIYSVCGIPVASDLSGRFLGFRPGLLVTVLGPFRTRQSAEAARSVVEPCAPDAYVKPATYLGD